MPAKYTATRKLDVASGRVFPVGAAVPVDAVDPDDPHDAALIRAGGLIENPSAARGGKAAASKTDERE